MAIELLWRRRRRGEDIITLRGVQCEVELQEPGGAQSEVELQMEVDQTRDVRLRRTRGNITE